jgi:hypothetical protein
VKTIKTYAERMRNEGVSRAMMVTIANITPFARQCLQEMAQKYYIETVNPLPPLISERIGVSIFPNGDVWGHTLTPSMEIALPVLNGGPRGCFELACHPCVTKEKVH